jgi:hypothetical protein
VGWWERAAGGKGGLVGACCRGRGWVGGSVLQGERLGWLERAAGGGGWAVGSVLKGEEGEHLG